MLKKSRNSYFCSVINIINSSFNNNNLFQLGSLDSHLISACNNKFMYYESISLQSRENKRMLRAQVLMKFIILITSSSISFISSANSFAVRTSPWMMRCVEITWLLPAALTNDLKPIFLSIIAFAPSVNNPIQFSHSKPTVIKKFVNLTIYVFSSCIFF